MKLLDLANGNLPRTNEEKKAMIESAAAAYGQFLTALGFDWKSDENSKKTPTRVAKAWVNDLISGSNSPEPEITLFPNPSYSGMVFEGGIEVTSMCSHHNLSFTGKAYIAYIPKVGGNVLGLSKLNRVVEWFARRPQIQEGLTQQIHKFLESKIDNHGLIVMIRASHSCVSCRGVGHQGANMVTCLPSGFFLENKDGCKDEFFHAINMK